MRRRSTRQNSVPSIGHVGILLDCPELRSKFPELVGQLATIVALEHDDRCRVRLDDRAETEAVVPASAFLSEFSSLSSPTPVESDDCVNVKRPRTSSRKNVKSENPPSAFMRVEPRILETAHDLAMLKETAQQLNALHGSSVDKSLNLQYSNHIKESDICCSICLQTCSKMSMIHCNKCDECVHASCDGISSSKLLQLRKGKQSSYLCPACRKSASEPSQLTKKDLPFENSGCYDEDLSPDRTSGLFSSICVLIATIQENRRRLRREGQQHQKIREISR